MKRNNSDSSLQIPYAKDDNKVVVPELAEPSRLYTCPMCEEPVFLRAGQVRQHHFAHSSSEKACGSNGEGIRHLQAKLQLYLALCSELPDIGRQLLVARPCTGCGRSHYQKVRLGRSLGQAMTEFRHITLSGAVLVFDIVVLDPKQSINFVLEVTDSHGVTDEKAEKLSGIPWIEVKADDVIRKQRQPIYSIHTGNLKPSETCNTSESAIAIKGHGWLQDRLRNRRLTKAKSNGSTRSVWIWKVGR